MHNQYQGVAKDLPLIKGYKSSTKRLASLFKRSRDLWKQRAADKQRKLRAQEIRIRDLEKSRELWKHRAKTAEQTLRESHTQERPQALPPPSHLDELPPSTTPAEGAGELGQSQWRAAHAHHYGVWMIQLAVAFVMESLNSFRGAARTLALLAQFFPLAIPSYSSIRQWVLRVGLYQLQRPREHRSDWLFIIDMTLELGTRKCLVILGISQARWQQLVQTAQGELSHHQMEVLAVEVMSQSKGEAIHQVLEGVSQQVGVPVQIVSDHGSDLAKGIRLYHQAHAQVLVSYDVSHQSARLLKRELEGDESYQAFASRCAHTRQQLQQGPLSFLMPPSQRSKARYFNVDTLLDWATKVLEYQQRQDFSLINPCFCLDQRALEALAPHLDGASLAQLCSLQHQRYPHQQALTQALQACLAPEDFRRFAPLILPEADLGRREFEQKLGWLPEYRSTLETYTQMLSLVRTLQQQLKQQGLSQDSKTDFIERTRSLQVSPRVETFRGRLLDYLEGETASLPSDKPFLGSSDMIESLFGKYKFFSGKSPLKHMGHLILTLPLLTVKVTAEVIKTALETVSFAAVENWYRQVFGISPLAKRRAAFQGKTVDTELA